MTAGRTVIFLRGHHRGVVAALLLFPQGFLKSITYAIIASVMLSAILSITVLAATLGILGPNVDALGVRTLLQGSVPAGLEGLPDHHRLAGREDPEDQDPPGGRERLLGQAGQPCDEAADPVRRADHRVHDRADHSAREVGARRHQREVPAAGQLGAAGPGGVRQDLPGFRTEPLTLVMKNESGQPVTDQQVAEVRNRAMAVSGFTDPDNNPDAMWKERPYLDGASKDPSVRVIQNGLVNRNDAAKKLSELRSITPPKGCRCTSAAHRPWSRTASTACSASYR
jgi:RND superfamily putative drug exporter